MKPIAKIIICLVCTFLLAAAIAGLILSRTPDPDRLTRAEFGFTGRPFNLKNDTFLGQPIPVRGRLVELKIRLATFQSHGAGELTLALLKGWQPPASPGELEQRTLTKLVVPEAGLKDNSFLSWRPELPNKAVDTEYYLVVSRRSPRPLTPLAVWLDDTERWPGAPAQRLVLLRDGRIIPLLEKGHIVLAWAVEPPKLDRYLR